MLGAILWRIGPGGDSSRPACAGAQKGRRPSPHFFLFYSFRLRYCAGTGVRITKATFVVYGFEGGAT